MFQHLLRKCTYSHPSSSKGILKKKLITYCELEVLLNQLITHYLWRMIQLLQHQETINKSLEFFWKLSRNNHRCLQIDCVQIACL